MGTELIEGKSQTEEPRELEMRGGKSTRLLLRIYDPNRSSLAGINVEPAELLASLKKMGLLDDYIKKSDVLEAMRSIGIDH